MSEPHTEIERISMYAQLEALYAALEMHVKRSETLSLEIQRLQKDLEDAPQEQTT